MIDYTTHAPYNFVPFSEQVILRYRSAEELPHHNRIEPGLKTGEIHVTITAQTPILVATQSKDSTGETTANFCHWNGRYMIPGSTIRGMTRANIQILGFGSVIPGEDIRDRPFVHRLSEGLPPRHQELAELKFPLDYPRAMFGYAGNNESYRSRVSFEDFVVQGKNPMADPPMWTIPGNPHPEWSPGYVLDGKNYSEEGFRLRGYKHYWMKETTDATERGAASVTARYTPLPAGTVFRGRVRYKNLYEDELGLLLWALRLEEFWEDEPCYQNIGLGKPYGLGRVLVHIDEIRGFDMEKLYSFEGLSNGPAKTGRGKVDSFVSSYVEAYQKYALDWLKKDSAARFAGKGPQYQSLLDYPEIKDFFFLHHIYKNEKLDLTYMGYGEHRLDNPPLPDAASLRTEWEEQRQAEKAAQAEQETVPEQSMEDMLKALQNRFKKV